MAGKERVEALRLRMRQEQIDTYIIPTEDDHQSEYVADYWKVRQWLSGFTGSAGTLVVTQEAAGLWTDGHAQRHTLDEHGGKEHDVAHERVAVLGGAGQGVLDGRDALHDRHTAAQRKD